MKQTPRRAPARNHCFADGNKRIALISIDVFLRVNGFELATSEEEAVLVINDLASGAITEQDLALWIERCAVPLDTDAEPS